MLLNIEDMINSVGNYLNYKIGVKCLGLLATKLAYVGNTWQVAY